MGIKNLFLLCSPHLSHCFLCISWFLATSLTTCSSLPSLFTLPSSPFPLPPPRGVCSLCTAIHQACHWSLRGGWRRLRGTRLISLLWLSRPAQREQAPATRAFSAPSSTYSRSHFCFSGFIPHSVQLLHSPISPWSSHLSVSPSVAQHMWYVCLCKRPLRIFVCPLRLRESCSFTSDRMFIKWASSGSVGFPDCLAAISS